ncbi:3-oxoacyl-[acyl-carrier-protein] reductase [Schizosaccharomyces cryophilus OY26]|uniref:3-oxoacyl-[acyl-carrier-protein] reductase n=1 Tax=Schizosaccharomyces cryophilus (strain OY26 / ATCC MYA-4695 / CBS 11777 / NBRC 106824 / NRRL Y48691) TaxID=653667 RepID=S9X1A0_SCHCR|nr:3-oxoacyl-[acyl-carrier-protein] reductase [Schizosaccharomyces cryophilus OY26]EPY50897.1 3-oxoacyl-[acyl-carrier-protein] reductase [Schizosaccharomyces cryophilus OY26]
MDTTVQAFGSTIHILVNNAGYLTEPKPIEMAILEDYNQTFDANIRAACIMTDSMALNVSQNGKDH